MKALICERCGASSFHEKDGYRICDYCGTKFLITKQDVGIKTTTISLNDDVTRLLAKCKSDPKNARRYASLVLDIDPDNLEALKFLRGGK